MQGHRSWGVGFGWGRAAWALVLLVSGCDAEGSNPEGSAPRTPPAGRSSEASALPAILIVGDSLTAGYGLPPEESYPALLQQWIDAEGLAFQVVNAGVSGDTTASGLRRIDWLLGQDVAVVVLALGGNDGLRGISPVHARENLKAIVNKIRTKDASIRIVLAGMRSPPNMGARFTGEFQRIFPDLADELDLPLIPFLLEDVGGVPSLNQADGIHPNAAGQELLARNVWEVLEPLLKKMP